ncbi:hypothetical protein C8A05DRAFT_36896 [Staphylotrichum tortipilum]|uniref:Uncharacterized protein n=1 Tax=Staphylotrichum tortipilum TaxID=2831512 RepID=A0AAN6RQA5_9PEZI|nr:hypothetical protein C8A05DRAFT_36896 [Staphylotrichum longicolle]
MNDPDDGGTGSADDWEFMAMSPSISSLSSFSPEDFSLPPDTHAADRFPHHHHHHHQQHRRQNTPTQARQKQITPPLTNPPKTRAAPSIPIPHLHTPPPTSPRRRPGTGLDLLSRSSSSSRGGGGGGVGGTSAARLARLARLGAITPTSTSGLGLHVGIATGRGVGLGAGLPVSPLPAVPWREAIQAEAGEMEEAEGGEYDDDEYDEEHDDGRDEGYADDEDEGSQTHVGEGSAGFKEYESLRGYGASQRSESSRRGEVLIPAYDGAMEYEEERRAESGGSRREEESTNEYDDERQEEDHEAGSGEIREEEGRGSTREEGEWRTAESRSTQSPGQEDEGETLPPGRVLLMERLCDVIQRLSSVRVGGGMEADVIDVLNAKVDEMEDLLVLAEETAEAEATADLEMQDETEEPAAEPIDVEVEPEPEQEPEPAPEVSALDAQKASEGEEPSEAEARREDEPPAEEEDTETQEQQPRPVNGDMLTVPPVLQLDNQDLRDLSSPLPWLTSTFRYSDFSISPTHSHPELAAATNEALEAAKQAAQAQADMAERIAREAEKVNLELAEVVKKLQSRKEESDHLHALLVDRAESAAARILDLEKEVVDLEDDILANESELRHLRLKLRAVETLCHELVAADADPDLVQSIENWKADWVLVRDRMLERKKDRKERRVRLHRAGCVISSLEQRENETTLSSLGGLSMSVSMLGLGRGRQGHGVKG